ncbi:CopG family transcriptional regulator [Nocardioides nanhaiensis]|uniref:Ribbon-helix-helix protein CopG domain-containing protein n=1 Tax=Nocardioides nanhaiensis TaxID=1476871 RepID=A0ABP8W106_9ACTN
MAFTLRTDPELDAALTVLAERDGVSRQEAVRRAVLEAADGSRHRGQVAASSERQRERWGDVLDRLGSV